MAVPGPRVANPTQATLFGVLGLVVLFLGGCLIGMVVTPGLIPTAWFAVVLAGVAMVMMALGAWFMWFGLSKVYPT